MGSFRKVGLPGQHTRIGLPVMLCTTVSFRARRTTFDPTGPSLDGETHWLLAHCSVLKVRAPTRRKDSKRWGRATSYCRHAAAWRQPIPRQPTPRHDFPRPMTPLGEQETAGSRTWREREEAV